MSGLLAGIRYLPRGLVLLTKPGILPYVLIPLAINVFLFTLLLIVAIAQFDTLLSTLMPALPDWLQWLDWLLWAAFVVAAGLVLTLTFTLIANLVSAPFNGLLAEAVERHLTGTRPKSGGWARALRELPGTLLGELRKLGYLASRALPLLVLFVIPGLNLIAPWLWLLYSAWALALEYSDYPLGNQGYAFPAQRELLRTERGTALSFGAGVLVMTMIPLLNLMVIPAAVAGATALWVDRLSGRREDL